VYVLSAVCCLLPGLCLSLCSLQETRSFFNAFFSLSAFHWHGFLSARLGFMQLIGE
jgi:hypothetical protein